MSLLSTYTDANKETDSLLAVRYTTEFFEDGYYYRLTRTAKKSYSYVGMTRAAAEACATAKTAQYTRNCCREDGENPVTDPDGRTHPGVYQELVCVAEVTVVRDHDDSWRCDIRVDESDYLALKSPPVDATSAFESYVSSRDYDETRPGITITGIANRQISGSTYIVLSLTNTISDLSVDEIIVQEKQNASSDQWYYMSQDMEIVSTVNEVFVFGSALVGQVFRVIARNRFSPAKTFTA